MARRAEAVRRGQAGTVIMVAVLAAVLIALAAASCSSSSAPPPPADGATREAGAVDRPRPGPDSARRDGPLGDQPQGLEPAPRPDAPAPSRIGAACAADLDCGAGLTCNSEQGTGWPEGYCYRAGCVEGECPTGSACTAVDGVVGCYRSCKADSECRSGYVCGEGVAGRGVSICMIPCESDYLCSSDGTSVCDPATHKCVVNTRHKDDARIGDPCQGHSDCQAGMACLPSPKWKNGYCSRFCSGGPTSCSPDAACVDFFGDQLCLKVCGSAADCRGAGYACETLPGSDQTVCRARCATSADCRPGQECDQQTGRCK